MSECNHEKCYAPYQLTSHPPLSPWVCRICGEEGYDRHRLIDDTEYFRLQKQFAELEARK